MSQIDTIADAVDALANPMVIRERYETWHGNNRKVRYHQHRMPSLLHQLEAAILPGETYAEDHGGHARRTPASCPPARLDAIDLCLRIQAWAADQAWRHTRTVRDNTARNLRALVGAELTSDTQADLLADLRRWTYAAQVIAGWQRPPWRPKAPCPACERHGLRIRLDTSTATCTQCGEGWDHTTIGLLAEHVRTTTQAVFA